MTLYSSTRIESRYLTPRSFFFEKALHKCSLPHRQHSFEDVLLPRRVHAGRTHVVVGQGIVDALQAERVAAGKVVRVAQEVVAAAAVDRHQAGGNEVVEGDG